MNVPNFISAFRIVSAPVMWWLLYSGNKEAFVWLLTAAFFSDAIDGIIARKLHQVSKLGSILDSYGDSLIILTGVGGLLVFYPNLIQDYKIIFVLIIVIHLIQLFLSLWRYGKPSSFHSFAAKFAAIASGLFLLITLHFTFIPFLFYITAFLLIVDAVEESILVFLLPQWKTDVKGIWWVLKTKK